MNEWTFPEIHFPVVFETFSYVRCYEVDVLARVGQDGGSVCSVDS
jgi:hypothetical protein